MAGDVVDNAPDVGRGSIQQSRPSLNESRPGSDEDVPDPWYGPEPGYHEAYALIDKAADKLIQRYTNNNLIDNSIAR